MELVSIHHIDAHKCRIKFNAIEMMIACPGHWSIIRAQKYALVLKYSSWRAHNCHVETCKYQITVSTKYGQNHAHTHSVEFWVLEHETKLLACHRYANEIWQTIRLCLCNVHVLFAAFDIYFECSLFMSTYFQFAIHSENDAFISLFRNAYNRNHILELKFGRWH